MDARDQRAIFIAAMFQIERKDGFWVVPSQTVSGRKYQVKLEGDGCCTCLDHKESGFCCKHIRAVKITLRRELGMDGTITETKTITIKERQRPRDHVAENAAKAIEPRRLKEMLFALVQGVKEPDHKRGRKPHDIRDMLFAMGLKVYRKFSSRKIADDLLSAHRDGYLTKPIPGPKVCAFFEKPELSLILDVLVRLSATPLRWVESIFAVDSTNFPNTKTENWVNHKTGHGGHRTIWTKAHAACGTRTHIVAAVRLSGAHDSQEFESLLRAVKLTFPIMKEVSADSAYLSGDIVDQVFAAGAQPYIDLKSNTTGGIGGNFGELVDIFKENPERYMSRYHQRSNIETVFSMVKATTGEPVWSKTPVAMKNEVLCKFLIHNLCVLNQEEQELGIDPTVWTPGKKPLTLAPGWEQEHRPDPALNYCI